MANASFPDTTALQDYVHAALRAWHTVGGTPENLLECLLLVHERRTTVASDGSPATRRRATNEILLESIEALEAEDASAANLLRWRFIDNQKLMSVAFKLNISEHSVSRQQRSAIEQLTRIIESREHAFRKRQAEAGEAHLPPPTYTRLFGLDDVCHHLVNQLLQSDSPWVIALVGLGGIGKTALADSVTRQVIRRFHFDRVIWLRTDYTNSMSGYSLSPQLTYDTLITDLVQHLLPEAANLTPDQQLIQVRQLLKRRPYLVVIDNLETQQDTAFLLAHLNDLAQPTRFLLTTRTRPSKQATVYSFSLDELSLPDATALIHHHAGELGIKALIEAAESDIHDIYSLTGGNPLALKLVVSLLDVLPLGQILEGFARGQAGPIEALYRHIYWQTWRVLSPDGRSLLKVMPLVGSQGGQPHYLQTMSGLSEVQLWPAIQELHQRSLLEVRGSLNEKRYGIHRLTESFVNTEIINWPDEPLTQE